MAHYKDIAHTPVEYAELRENIIHRLRSRGWSLQEAEDEADERVHRQFLRDEVEARR